MHRLLSELRPYGNTIKNKIAKQKKKPCKHVIFGGGIQKIFVIFGFQRIFMKVKVFKDKS
jgi:hypothetical protein